MKRKSIKVGEVSPRFSLKGWKATEWLKGNWSTVKELIKIGVPFVAGLELFPDKPYLTLAVTAFGKFALDVLHYWAKEQQLEE